MTRLFCLFCVIAALIAAGTASHAQTQTWTNIGYIDLEKRGHMRWDNRLEITPEAIIFTPAGGQPVRILKSRIVELRYGKAATAPPQLFSGSPCYYALELGLLPVTAVAKAIHHPEHEHIGIIVSNPRVPRFRAGLSFGADKASYQSILAALKQGTTAPLLVSEHDSVHLPPDLDRQITSHENEYMVAGPLPEIIWQIVFRKKKAGNRQ